MFDYNVISNKIESKVRVPHAVRVHSPTNVDFRPRDLSGITGGYQVVLEWADYDLQVKLVTDQMAVGLRRLLSSKHETNPEYITSLEDRIESSGWQKNVVLGDGRIQVSAVKHAGAQQLMADEIDQIVDEAIDLVAHVSHYVLDHLHVVGVAGATKPSSKRSTDRPILESSIWEYDPTERERATLSHIGLENWLIMELTDRGLSPLDPAGPPYFDVAWHQQDILYVCEVKSSSGDQNKQLRLGIGQVLDYRHELERALNQKVDPLILIESRPRRSNWTAICKSAGIKLFWPEIWADVAKIVATKVV